MDNYVKSTAGYCVVTYLLGVGDRHLENVLLSPNGLLIHIDFGFILGRDPKPLPPPFKLVKEMVDAMGGQQVRRETSWYFVASLSLQRPRQLPNGCSSAVCTLSTIPAVLQRGVYYPSEACRAAHEPYDADERCQHSRHFRRSWSLLPT